jgi:membrane protease YdiL (CAAX protease family)
MSRTDRSEKLAIAFALVFPTIVTLAYFDWLSEADTRLQQVAYGVGKFIQFAFPAVWVFLVRRQRVARRTWTTNGVGMGIGSGLCIAAAMLLLYVVWLKPTGFFAGPAEQVRTKVDDLGIRAIPIFITVAVFYSLVHSFLEEYYWRWFVFAQLKQFTTAPVAIAVSSLGFMAHHVLVLATFFGWDAPATWLFSLAVAVGGAAWAALYHRYQSLLGPWFSHLLVDAAIFAIGYDLIRV